MTIELYRAEHGAAVNGHTRIEAIDALNLTSGPAFSLLDGKTVLACGGVRVLGIGQAWAAFAPDALKDFPKSILRATRETLERCIEQERLYRLYAESTVETTAWFKHLGFVNSDKLYVR